MDKPSSKQTFTRKFTTAWMTTLQGIFWVVQLVFVLLLLYTRKDCDFDGTQLTFIFSAAKLVCGQEL